MWLTFKGNICSLRTSGNSATIWRCDYTRSAIDQ